MIQFLASSIKNNYCQLLITPNNILKHLVKITKLPLLPLIYIFEETYRMNSIIKNNIEQITTLCNSYNVKSLFVFGSVCTPDFNKTSDIDLLISFNQMDYADNADNFFLLADKFEELFKRPVDLVTDKSLSNPYFIKSVNTLNPQAFNKKEPKRA